MKTIKSLKLLFVTLSVLNCPFVWSAVFTDTLENIGADGTPVTSRIIGGVTVNISNSGVAVMGARTYFSNTLVAFGGDQANNAPLNPGNVSLTRFISTRNSSGSGGISTAQPIIFDFSTPVFGFGLTTVDLLEDGTGDRFLRLQALDSSGSVVDTHTRIGNQGPSGLDLDWFVSSSAPEITQAILSTNIGISFGGYGIDDLVISNVPVPAAVWLFGSGLIGLLGFVKRKSPSLTKPT